MRKIYKYRVMPGGFNRLMMPYDAKVVSAGLDGQGDLCVWASLDADDGRETQHRVLVVGTGHEHDPDGMRFVGSVTQGPLVWHVYTEEEQP